MLAAAHFNERAAAWHECCSGAHPDISLAQSYSDSREVKYEGVRGDVAVEEEEEEHDESAEFVPQWRRGEQVGATPKTAVVVHEDGAKMVPGVVLKVALEKPVVCRSHHQEPLRKSARIAATLTASKSVAAKTDIGHPGAQILCSATAPLSFGGGSCGSKYDPVLDEGYGLETSSDTGYLAESEMHVPTKKGRFLHAQKRKRGGEKAHESNREKRKTRKAKKSSVGIQVHKKKIDKPVGSAACVDVVADGMRERRLPPRPLFEYSNYLQKRLTEHDRDCYRRTREQNDRLPAYKNENRTGFFKSNVPSIEIPFINADRFDDVVDGIINHPRFGLPERCRVHGYFPSTDTKEVEWDLEKLRAVYLAADDLGCVMMRNAITDRIIQKHRTTFTLTTPDEMVTNPDTGENEYIRVSPHKLRYIVDFFEMTSSDRTVRQYFIDICLLHRHKILQTWQEGSCNPWPVNLSDSDFWQYFVFALAEATGEPTVLNKANRCLDNDFCLYHEHKKYGFKRECPTHIHAAESREARKAAALRIVIDRIENVRRESDQIVHEVSSCEVEMEQLKKRQQDLLDQAQKILAVVEEMAPTLGPKPS